MDPVETLLGALVAFFLVVLVVLLYGFFWSLHRREGGAKRQEERVSSLEQEERGGCLDPVDSLLLHANRLYVNLHKHYGWWLVGTAVTLCTLALLKVLVARIA